MSITRLIVWLLSLAALAVGARNFELGISIDGPLYAAIARNIARTGEYFRLYGNVPDFVPFTEHPHLGFWTLAALFKVLPAEDWVARMPGHIFYVLSLGMIFLWTRRYWNERAALWAVLLLWTWPVFSNYYSTVYLDPGLFVFGFAATLSFQFSLERRSWIAAAFAGIGLGAAFLQKGFAALGFGPVFAGLFLSALWDASRQKSLRKMAFVCASSFIVLLILGTILGLYFKELSESSVPDFLSRYIARQWTGRFHGAYTEGSLGLLNQKFWNRLFRETNFLIPLGLFVFFKRPERREAWLIPGLILAAFVFMYAPASRAGQQYGITLFPGIAIFVAVVVAPWIPGSVETWRRFTMGLSLAGVCLLQYLPIRTHSLIPPTYIPDIVEWRQRASAKTPFRLYLDNNGSQEMQFIQSAVYAWYADVEIAYVYPGQPSPAPAPHTAFMFEVRDVDGRERDLKRVGWCLHKNYERATLWVDCQKQQK